MWNLFITFVTQFIPALWLAATHEATQLTNFIGPRARHYWHIFLWLAVVAIGAPLCLTGLAILTKAGWLIALIGLLIACFLAVMLFKPVYIGLTVLLGTVWNLLNAKIKGTADVGAKWAKAYINIVGGFLLWELIVIFFISVFPIWNNLAALPIIALCSAILPLMISIWGLGGRIFRRVAYLLVLFVLIFEIGSLVFPLTGKAVVDKRPKLDKKMADWVKNPTLPKLKLTPQAQAAPTPQAPAVQKAEVVCVTVTVPANTIVETAFKTVSMQRVYFDRVSGESDDPSQPSYYIKDRLRESPMWSKRENCSFGDSNYIWLKGGPTTTRVMINRYGS